MYMLLNLHQHNQLPQNQNSQGTPPRLSVLQVEEMVDRFQTVDAASAERAFLQLHGAMQAREQMIAWPEDDLSSLLVADLAPKIEVGAGKGFLGTATRQPEEHSEPKGHYWDPDKPILLQDFLLAQGLQYGTRVHMRYQINSHCNSIHMQNPQCFLGSRIKCFAISIIISKLMSSIYYNQKWEEAIGGLLECAQEENYPLEQNRNQKGITYKRTDLEWFQYYAGLYIRYVQAYTNLENSYDQMVHPQKRILMKEMLDNLIVRMLEVKQNLIKYSTHSQIIQSDYVNIDEILIDMKLTPKALEIPLPRYFLDKKTPRDQQIQEIVKDLEVVQEEEVYTENTCLDEPEPNSIIRIIQKIERGRQGIVRALDYQKHKAKQKDRSEGINDEDKRAIVVQQYWRAFLARRKLSQIRANELHFLGIKKDPIPKSLLEEAEDQRKKLKILQRNREEKLEQEKETIKFQIKNTEEASIKAAMLEERRKWVKKFLEMHEFSSLPPNSKDFYKDKEGVQEPVVDKKGKGKDKKDKKKEEKGKAKGKGKKNEVEQFLDDHVPIGPTESVVKMEENIKSYTETWGTRDQTEVSEEFYDTDIAQSKLRPEIVDELEKVVDSIVNLELDNMRIKYGIKKKKEKKARKPKKKANKVKIPQGLGKRNPADLLTQLFENNIAKRLAPAKTEDFLGEHNPVTYIIERTAEILPDPSYSQVRNIVKESIGIPLGSQEAKAKLEKSNWFLFFGPPGTGKTLLIRGLQQEVNALVFDITPDNVKDKYKEKSELTKLLWSVIICAKEYQPSIVIADDYETIFSGVKGKKKDKDGAVSFGPKMKKVLTDMKKKNKLWTKTDRVAVICCTNRPYNAALKDTKKLFDKKIYFPYPNYATRMLLLKHLINSKAGKELSGLPYQTLALVTEGFTAGSFRLAIDKILTPLRIQKIEEEPIRVNEIVNALSNTMYVFSEEYEKIKKFMDDVTGLKERREAAKQPTQDDKKDKKKPKKK